MRPANEAELAEAVRAANGPLRISGGGTRGIGLASGEALATGGLSGIRLYEPGALTLVAGAGTPLAEVEAALAAEGQRLAFEPPDLRGLLGRDGQSTLGGVAAANASGPRRVQAGACRDSMIGLRFVDGSGTVIANGGRVMKNVTGYDLVKLLAGSHGTLGVLTELAFKLQARPEAEATLICRGQGAEAGIAALTAALGTPFDISGAAWLDAGATGADARTQVRVEGLAASVAYRAGRLRDGVLRNFDIVEGEASAALWREVRDVTPFAGRAGAVWRLSVTPTLAAGVVAAIRAAGHDDLAAIHDWGGGLIWLLLPVAGDAESGDAGAGAVRDAVAQRGGHATLMRGPAGIAAFPPQPPALAAIEAGLRARFDPRGILNTGLMG
ncbi:FAD-binding protein [Szabonella alba]|uniref:FAD-binding protein n=1 Tax=Szabonella alba TaxID=2804194 RepID=A0A8K0VBN0_9RHOB|nr:FAD-binding protein [Szabonella alba]MBL4916195.1 FAD-binding protein [Szabonella alba]